MKKSAHATKKLKADLARARLERLARPKRPKRSQDETPADAIADILDRVVGNVDER